MKQWVVFSLPRPYRFILNFSILRHLVEINCGTPSYAPLVVRQCSGFLFSTFLPDKILNRLFGMLAIQSDNQAYKQAGNGVTVNVIEAIGRRIAAMDAELRGEALAP